jgi:hypothetical protein
MVVLYAIKTLPPGEQRQSYRCICMLDGLMLTATGAGFASLTTISWLPGAGVFSFLFCSQLTSALIGVVASVIGAAL